MNLFFLEYFDLFFVIAVRKQFGVFQKEQNRLSAHNLFSSKQKRLSKNKKPMKNWLILHRLSSLVPLGVEMNFFIIK